MYDADLPERDRLAVALDLPTLDEALPWMDRLEGLTGWFKVGAELFTAAGPAAIEQARRRGRVFLDTKLHDIPNTVAAAVRAAAHQGVGLLTLHASGGRAMLEAARAAAEEFAPGERPRLLAVTVLTSLDETALREIGVSAGLPDQVERLAELAIEAGVDGVVCSPREVAAVRRRVGAGPMIVTPGVRTPRGPQEDQRRTATCQEAIRAGADLVVVGRPILRASDPTRAARVLLESIREARGSVPA